MVNLFITVDTEYSAGLYQGPSGSSLADNFRRSIGCETSHGEVGIRYQMDVLDDFGLKAVFFVDPMPSLIWGLKATIDIVEPILQRGHDVQLHLHSEWLEFADNNPLGNKTGRNIKDFTLEEQKELIGFCSDLLVHAGAPKPVAFRAGNYGANDDTLRALHHHGISYDSSFCPGIENSDCDISLGPDYLSPIRHCDVIEVPIGAVATSRGGRRHAQLTALSQRELQAAFDHAAALPMQDFTIVSHSFELLSRDRKRVNAIVKRRFENLCKWIAASKDVKTATYRENPPQIAESPESSLLPHNPLRTAERMAEQAIGNLLYGAG